MDDTLSTFFVSIFKIIEMVLIDKMFWRLYVYKKATKKRPKQSIKERSSTWDAGLLKLQFWFRIFSAASESNLS